MTRLLRILTAFSLMCVVCFGQSSNGNRGGSSGSSTVVYASRVGATLSTNLSSGGGTDDTARLQSVLNTVPAGGLVLVMDGPALVSGLNLLSNTTIQCQPGAGFYLANGSNREVIRNVNRSGSSRTDTNITISGCYINGNKSNQSGVSQSDHTPMVGIGFYGISNLKILNTQVYNASAWGISASNATNVLMDSDYVQTTTPVSNLNTDGIDIRGPADSVMIRNFRSNSGDDAIALNSRSYSSTIVGPYIAGGNITDVTVDGLQLDGAFSGVDIISTTFQVDRVGLRNLHGTVQNFAVWMSRDPFNSPDGTGIIGKVTVDKSDVTQSGTAFGSSITPGLYPIDTDVSNYVLNNVTVYDNLIANPAGTVNPTSNGNVSMLCFNTNPCYGIRAGAFTTNPPTLVDNFKSFFPINWTLIPGLDALSHATVMPTITSGSIQGNTGGTLQPALFAASVTSDQHSKITAGVTGGDANSAIYAFTRVQQGTSLNLYQCWANNGSINLSKVVNNTVTSLGTTAQAITANDTIDLVAIGNGLNCFYNGTRILTATDSTFANGSVGMAVFGNTSHSVITAWQGGSMVSNPSTSQNCAAVGTSANPSVAQCGYAPAGTVSCSVTASTGTCTVNTTAVTANSQIVLLQRTDTTTGTRLSVTCNTTKDTNSASPQITAVTAATSFTFQLGTISTNPECFSYYIVN